MSDSTRILILVLFIFLIYPVSVLGDELMLDTVTIVVMYYLAFAPITLMAIRGYSVIWVSKIRFLAVAMIGIVALLASTLLEPYIPRSYKIQICTLLRNPLFAVVAISLVPFVEEGLFRGILAEALRRRLGPIPALVIVTAIFATVHMPYSLSLAVAYIVTSLVITTAYLVAGLASSLMLHVAFNVSAVLGCLFT